MVPTPWAETLWLASVKAAVSKTIEYGAPVSSTPTGLPSIKNWMPLTGAPATSAAIVIVPEALAPSCGSVIVIAGVGGGGKNVIHIYGNSGGSVSDIVICPYALGGNAMAAIG